MRDFVMLLLAQHFWTLYIVQVILWQKQVVLVPSMLIKFLSSRISHLANRAGELETQVLMLVLIVSFGYVLPSYKYNILIQLKNIFLSFKNQAMIITQSLTVLLVYQTEWPLLLERQTYQNNFFHKLKYLHHNAFKRFCQQNRCLINRYSLFCIK